VQETETRRLAPLCSPADPQRRIIHHMKTEVVPCGAAIGAQVLSGSVLVAKYGQFRILCNPEQCRALARNRACRCLGPPQWQSPSHRKAPETKGARAGVRDAELRPGACGSLPLRTFPPLSGHRASQGRGARREQLLLRAEPPTRTDSWVTSTVKSQHISSVGFGSAAGPPDLRRSL
jgi:hypothetical protein